MLGTVLGATLVMVTVIRTVAFSPPGTFRSVQLTDCGVGSLTMKDIVPSPMNSDLLSSMNTLVSRSSTVIEMVALPDLDILSERPTVPTYTFGQRTVWPASVTASLRSSVRANSSPPILKMIYGSAPLPTSHTGKL